MKKEKATAKSADDIYYIYGLIDPKTDIVRYIGKTNNPKRRLSGHIYEATHPETSLSPESIKNKWIRKLKEIGLYPTYTILEITTRLIASKREKYWIAQYGRDNLVNGNDGDCSYQQFQKSKVYDFSKIKETRNSIISQLAYRYKKEIYNGINNWLSIKMYTTIDNVIDREGLLDIDKLKNAEKIRNYSCSEEDIDEMKRLLLRRKNIISELKNKTDTNLYIEFLTKKLSDYHTKDSWLYSTLDVFFDGEITEEDIEYASELLSNKSSSGIYHHRFHGHWQGA